MVMAHYATALIAYAYTKKQDLAPFWVFLLASQFLDFMMVFLVFIGIEKVEPSAIFATSFLNMRVDMSYSHDLYPVLLWSVLLAVLLGSVYKKYILGFWVLGLMLMHEFFDFLIGFEHYLFKAGSAAFGFNVYNTIPFIGISLEAVLCFILVYWYIDKRQKDGEVFSRKRKLQFYVLFVGFTLALLPIASQPLNAIF